jgi:hypothetical protein
MNYLKLTVIILIYLTVALAQQSPFTDRSTLLNVPKQYGNYGAAVIDYNKDGWEDIFIANVPSPTEPETSYCVLLRNNSGENFTNVSVSAGIRTYGSSKCGAWGDVNNDGYPDLFIADAFQYGRSRLYINAKNGTFREAGGTGIDGSAHASTAAFGDYDNDGKLDLFIATEYPEFDLLYRNTSHGDTISFQDVSSAAGVEGFSSTAPMQATFIDIDHDGDQDLYAVHDGFLPSSLFRNNGDGSFTDIAMQNGLFDYGAGNSMGLYWKDYDTDGWEEVYVSRIGKAGLYQRQPDGKYKNIADSAGAEFNGMTWGIVWEDFDNDGDDDIYGVNTYGFNSVRNIYYENVNGKFIDKAAEYGINFAHSFYGLAYGDFNNDGYLDLIAPASDGNNKLLLNTGVRQGNWIRLSLQGTTVNRMAVGTVVRISAGNRTQTRIVTAGNSYASQMSPIVHFGIGQHQTIDTLEIIWNKVNKQLFTNVKVNTLYSLTQGGTLNPTVRVRAEGYIPTSPDLLTNYPNPFNPSTTIVFSLAADLSRRGSTGPRHAVVSVWDLLGQKIATLYEGPVQNNNEYRILFNGSMLPSGIYFARMNSGSTILQRKMLLLK